MSADAVGVKSVTFTAGTTEVGGTAGSVDTVSSVGVVIFTVILIVETATLFGVLGSVGNDNGCVGGDGPLGVFTPCRNASHQPGLVVPLSSLISLSCCCGQITTAGILQEETGLT